VFELSTAVVEVDVKVINASLSANQCLQCAPPASTHAEIPRPCDAWSEQWQLDQVGRRPLLESFYEMSVFVCKRYFDDVR